jgi:hypothetical protein
MRNPSGTHARLAAVMLAASALLAGEAGAQERLVARGLLATGPQFEQWTLTDGLPHGTGGTRLSRVAQWSVPVAASTAVGEQWTVDVMTAYASGTVTLNREDPVIGARELTLSGPTDVRVRATGRFLGERLLLTLGANVPTGATELDAEQVTALRALSAPAFGLQAPLLGAGGAATAGLVYALPVGASWAWAFGSSYEYRASYSPAAVSAGIATPDFSPAAAVHFSLGADGLVGRHGATLTASLDLFGEDRVGATSGAAPPPTRLGPVATVDARLRLAAEGFRELTIYAVDRYRTSFERGGESVPESAGNYLDAGVSAVRALGARTGLLTGLNVRHHTGLAFDDGIQTAAAALGALTLGVTHAFGSGLELAPFVRGQLGRVESASESSAARGFAGGVTLTRRF